MEGGQYRWCEHDRLDILPERSSLRRRRRERGAFRLHAPNRCCDQLGSATSSTRLLATTALALSLARTEKLCLAAASGSAGNILFSSTNPTGGVRAWKGAHGVDQSLPLVALACLSESYCLAEDVATNLVRATDPTGGASAWTTTFTGGEGGNHLRGGASCQSASLCVAVGARNVVTSADPLGGP